MLEESRCRHGCAYASKGFTCRTDCQYVGSFSNTRAFGRSPSAPPSKGRRSLSVNLLVVVSWKMMLYVGTVEYITSNYSFPIAVPQCLQGEDLAAMHGAPSSGHFGIRHT